MFENLAVKALVFGLLSAVSLPLGSLTAAFWKPKDRTISFFMSFGAGALLAALAIELVAERVNKGEFFPLAIGCIVGSLTFMFFNQLINSKGGFMRKAATLINHMKRKKEEHYGYIFQKMSRVSLFQMLPPEEIQALVQYVSSRTFVKGSIIFRQGEPGDSLFIIENGEVEILDTKNNNTKIATLRQNDVLGEIALVTGESRTASAMAATDIETYMILKDDFDRLLSTSPILAEATHKLVNERISDLEKKKAVDPEKAYEWAQKALHNIGGHTLMPTEAEIKEEVAEASSHSGAPLAIWLGMLLDGIPESVVLGSSLLVAPLSLSLMAGLVLSNYPEALSSSVGMQQQGKSFGKVFWMWASLMLILGVASLGGNLFFAGASSFVFAVVEGMAAGAMLTMIAETMLPEAFYKGRTITGISTLLGFLSAIFFKTLE